MYWQAPFFLYKLQYLKARCKRALTEGSPILSPVEELEILSHILFTLRQEVFAVHGDILRPVTPVLRLVSQSLGTTSWKWFKWIVATSNK